MLWSTVFVVLFCLIHFQCDVEGRSYLRWHHPRWHRPRRITYSKWHHRRRTEGKSCDIHLGWMEYNHHCYLLSFFTSTWDEAESYCKNHNSHLVRIETAKENDWITTKISKLNYGDHVVWTGGNDINEEGTWKWTSDSPCFTYTNWDKSYKEPNGGRKENCLNIIHEKGSSRNGKWNDLSCRRKLYFMCEKKKW